MKPLYVTALFALLCACPTAGSAAPPSRPVEQPTRTISIFVNGQQVGEDTPAVVRDGRLLVPLRAIFEALAVAVTRSGDTLTARLPVGTLSLTVGSERARIDDRVVTLEAPIVEVDGTTYGPLSLLKAAFGANATYDQHGTKVEIVSALIGRTTGGAEQRAGGGTTVNGTIAAIDALSAPPSITVTLGAESRTISLNSDARITIQDVTVHSQVKSTLDQLRVGDRVAVLLAADGRVVEVDGFYSSDSGTLSAVSPIAVVMANGKVVQPGRTTDISLNGSSAVLADLHVGDYVTVRRNPETGEIRQIIASRTVTGPPTAAPVAADVKITAFTISVSRPLRAGESFDITLQGTPHGHASYDIGDYLSALPMREETAGTYVAQFTIPDRFNVAQVPIFGHLSVGSSEARRAEAATTLSAATVPPQIPEVAPPPGQVVDNPRPSIYATFVAPSQLAIVPASINLSLNGHDVTSAATRTASFIAYTPGVDIPDGDVRVVVRVTDAAGNTTTRSWTFTIKTR